MIKFQQMRPDKFTLAVQVATHRDNYTHTLTYTSLDEAHANYEQDVAEVTRLAHLRAEFQDAMDKLPGLYEHTAHVDTRTRRIVVSMVSLHLEGVTHAERFPVTQLAAELHELPEIHAQHMEHVEQHKAAFAERTVKIAILKGLK